MTAYMDLNGIPATGNDWLMTEVLRDTWGFDGFLVSDANAVRSLMTHGFASDLDEAGARGVNAGVDLEMAVFDPAYGHLTDAVARGLVTESAIDACVRRILRAKLRLGLFDSPYVDEARAAEVLNDPSHRDAARAAAVRTAVLLQNVPLNGTPLLPLSPQNKKIAVVGPLADSQRDTLGPWVFDFDLAETVTILDGLKARAGDGVTVEYAPGIRPGQRHFQSMFDMWPGNRPADPEGFDDAAELDRAAKLAAASDVAIIVLGEWQNMIGEAASRSTLDLPGRQLELLDAVAATGTPVVVLVMNGRPLDLQPVLGKAAAILDVWYPGSQGGHAVASLVFGDSSPAGRRRLRGCAPPQIRSGYAHDQPRAREPVAPLLGHRVHAAVPVRSGPVVRVVQLLGRPAVGRDHRVRREPHGVRRRHEHVQRGRRRGGPALRAPDVGDGVASGARAQGLPAGARPCRHDGDRRVAHRAGSAQLLERRQARLGAGHGPLPGRDGRLVERRTDEVLRGSLSVRPGSEGTSTGCVRLT